MKMHIETLQSFNRRTEKLTASPLFDKVLNGNISCGFKWNAGKPIEIEATEFNPVELESFILTVRLFVQDNEAISIRNICALYDKLNVPEERKEAIRKARTELNSFLDSPLFFRWKDGPTSYRVLFETVMYGELAHENQEKARHFKEWTACDFIRPNVWTLFLFCLQSIICAVSFIRCMNINTIKENGG